MSSKGEELIFTATIPGNAASGTNTTCKIMRPRHGTVDQEQLFVPMRESWHLEDIYTVGAYSFPETAFIPLVNLMGAGAFLFSTVSLWKMRNGKAYVPKTVTWRSLRHAYKLRYRKGLNQTIAIPQGSVLSGIIMNLDVNGQYDFQVSFRAWLAVYNV